MVKATWFQNLKIYAEFVVKYTRCRCFQYFRVSVMIDLHSAFMPTYFKYIFLNHKVLKAKKWISQKSVQWGFWISINFTNKIQTCKIFKATSFFADPRIRTRLDKFPLNFVRSEWLNIGMWRLATTIITTQKVIDWKVGYYWRNNIHCIKATGRWSPMNSEW